MNLNFSRLKKELYYLTSQIILRNLETIPYFISSFFFKFIYSLSERFGCLKIDDKLLEKFEQVTSKPVHHLLKRGIFFSHR